MNRLWIAALWLIAGPALAQDGLVVRAALVPLSATATTEIDGMERAELPMRSPYDTEPRSVFLGDTLLVLGPGSVASVHTDMDEVSGEGTVALVLAPEATNAFAELTVEYLGEALALVLDGRVLAAPRVNLPIPSGRLQITGVGTVEAAEALAGSIANATDAEVSPD